MLSIRSRASLAVSTGVLPRLTTCLGPRTEAAGLKVDDAAAGQPVEQHADGGEVLLDGRGGFGAGELLDVGGDVYRLDAGQGEAVSSHHAKKSPTALA